MSNPTVDVDFDTELNVGSYVRKPVPVAAIQVSDANFEDVVEWCGGIVEFTEPKTPEDSRFVTRRYIRVNVQRPLGERQTMAFPGDWILRAGTGYKVYTHQAFISNFDVYNKV